MKQNDNDNILLGKLPPDLLSRSVLGFSGAARDDVLVGGGLGEDAALIRWPGGSPYLVVASDPITGASEGAGRLLVHVNANDVACKGADPAWFVVTLIVPARDGLPLIENTMREIHEVCLDMGVSVVGGHTELTDRYDRPVMSGTMFGIANCRLGAGLIRSGDVIVAAGHAGLEGMSILANDRPDLLKRCLSPEEIGNVKTWNREISVVPAARALRGFARYMHDPTEGGFLGALAEIQEACGLSLELDESAVPVSPLTRRAAEVLGFNPLRLISSGMLLAVIPPDKVSVALEASGRTGITACTVGSFTGPRKKGPVDMREELWDLLNRDN